MAEPVGALRIDVTANSAQVEGDLKRIGGVVNSASARMRRSMAGFATGANRAFHEVINLRTALVALAGGAMVSAERRAIALGDNIAKTAQKIGISTDSLQELRYGAELAGASNQQLDQILLQLSKRIGLAQTQIDETGKALGRLGIDIRTLKGLKADQVFKIIADRIRAIKDPMTQARIATQLFEDSGQQLLPFLRSGSIGIAKVAQEAHKLGLVLSGETLRKAESANDEFSRMGSALRIAGIEIAASFLPVLREFRRIVTAPEFIAGVRSLADSTREWVKYLVEHKSEVLTILGALTGFKIGRAFGPIGALFGAGVGAAAGFKSARSELEKINDQLAQLADKEKGLRAILAQPHSSYAERNVGEQLLAIEMKRNDLVKQRAALESRADTQALASAQNIANYIQGQMSKAGYNTKAIAAALAAVKHESDFNPSNINKTSGAFGLFQWLGDRKTALKEFADQAGTSINDVRTQVAFFLKELDQGEKKAGGLLKAAANPEAASAAMNLFERFAGYTDKFSADVQQRAATTVKYFDEINAKGHIAANTVTRLTINKPAPVFDLQVAKAIEDITFKTRIARGEFQALADGFPELVNGFQLSRAQIQGFTGDVSKLSPQLQALNAAMQRFDAAKQLQNAAHDIAGAFESSFENAILNAQNLQQVLAGLAKDLARIFLRLALLKPLESAFGGLLGGLSGGGAGLGGLFSFLPKFADGGSFTVGGAGGTDSQLTAFRATPGERVDISTPGRQRERAAAAPVNVENRTRVVNLFDSVDVLSHALSQAAGERVLINVVRANAGAINSALSG